MRFTNSTRKSFPASSAASRAASSSSSTSSSSGESSESELESDEDVKTYTREELRRARADNRIRFATLSQNERSKHVFYCQHHTDPVTYSTLVRVGSDGSISTLRQMLPIFHKESD